MERSAFLHMLDGRLRVKVADVKGSPRVAALVEAQLAELLDEADRLPGDVDRLRDLPEVPLEDRDVSRLAGDVGPAAHGDPDVGECQRRRVVDAVADDGDRRAALLERPHEVRLL